MRPSLCIFAFAAGIRLAYLALARPYFTRYYWHSASGLLQTGSLSLDGVQTAALEPLYPLFLAAARWPMGDRPLLVQAAQALVASAGAVCLYRLAAALTGRRRPAIAAALLYAAYPLLVHHSIDGTESALLGTLLIAFAHRFVTMRSSIGAATAGLWLGLAVLTRMVALPLVVLAPLLAAARSARAAALIAAVSAAVLAPYGMRNYALNGAVVPSRSGINLFISNCEYAPGVIAAYGPDILMPYAESRIAAEGLADLPLTPEAEQQRDAAYLRLAIAEMRRHPLETLRLKIRNVFDFFSPVLVPYRDRSEATTVSFGPSGQVAVVHGVARPLRHRIAYSISYAAVLVLAAFGVWRRRGHGAADAILWCTLLTFAAVHAVFFPATRYRAPVEFVLLFYSGVGVDALLPRRHTTPQAVEASGIC